MKIERRNMINFFIVGCLFIYVIAAGISSNLTLFDAALTLFFSILLLIKARKNTMVVLLSFFILYCNYSIVVGEYLVGGSLGVPLFEVKSEMIYGLNIRVLLLFMGIIAIFYNAKNSANGLSVLKPKDNLLIYFSLLIGLLFSLVFGMNREGDISNYSVRISPLYEYSTILFVFAYYYSGRSKARKYALAALAAIFILQDFYYGGRITSLQIALFLLSTIFIQRISFKSVLTYGLIGIFVNGVIGAYRHSRDASSGLLVNTFHNLKDNLLVFDTPVYAYYASATHIAASGIAGIGERFSSFLHFILAIFMGSGKEIGNVTAYVSNNYFNNIGGGIIPTHFYFWAGWFGVIVVACLLTFILKNSTTIFNTDLKMLFFLVFVITAPRWYLYSPLSLFRPLFFIAVLFLALKVVHHIVMVATKGRHRVIKTTVSETYN